MLHSKKKRELVVEQKNTYTIQHATDHVARFTKRFPPLIKTVEGKEYGIHLVSNVSWWLTVPTTKGTSFMFMR